MAVTDVVGMLLQRRAFRAGRLSKRIRAILLFTDASPVTGEEFQGMLMETVRTGRDVTRDVLPGCTLQYGHGSGTAKGVALLFARWLVAGPFLLTYSL